MAANAADLKTKDLAQRMSHLCSPLDNIILFQLWLGHNSTSGNILHLRDVRVNSNCVVQIPDQIERAPTLSNRSLSFTTGGQLAICSAQARLLRYPGRNTEKTNPSVHDLLRSLLVRRGQHCCVGSHRAVCPATHAGSGLRVPIDAQGGQVPPTTHSHGPRLGSCKVILW
jgi:hypothetical protein